jgi:hypothetical protein
VSSRSVDAEQQRRQARANELMLAVAGRLIGEARIAGAFPTGDAALGAFRTRLVPEFADDEHIVLAGEDRLELPRSDYKLELEAEVDSVRLSCRYGSHGISGRLRLDGAIVEGLFSVGVSFDDPAQRVELPPADAHAMAKAIAAMEEDQTTAADFRGEELRRALAVQPQRGAPVQILAFELYGDGLVVRYTYDSPVMVQAAIPLHFYEMAGVEPPLDKLLVEAEEEEGTLEPNLSVTDDVGTSYRHAGGSRGGMEVAHGETSFTPAVPAAATRLVVSSYAGTVEVDLQRH